MITAIHAWWYELCAALAHVQADRSFTAGCAALNAPDTRLAIRLFDQAATHRIRVCELRRRALDIRMGRA